MIVNDGLKNKWE